MSILRERIWQLCDIRLYQIRVNIDTTVETVYGNQKGARKGHNTKHRGKKGLRPILGFIEETREYLVGKLRKGTTVSGKETAAFIWSIKEHLPGCVQSVLLRADGEFLSWESIEAAIKAGFRFIIANKGCDPPFDSGEWYRPFVLAVHPLSNAVNRWVSLRFTHPTKLFLQHYGLTVSTVSPPGQPGFH